VKTAIVLKLIKRREAFEAASFSFTSFEAMHAAMQAVALEHVDDENFGLDQALQQGQIGRNDDVGTKAKIAASVMKSSGGMLKGAAALAKMALAGDKALRQSSYAVHYLVDGVDATEAKAKMAVLRATALKHGDEIPNTVPTIVRGMPFAPLANTLGPKGERWVPIHGLLPHDKVVAFHHALGDLWDANADEMAEHGIYTGGMFMTVSSNAFVYEPAFYWPGAQTIFHERMVPADHLKSLPTYADTPAAKAVVIRLKAAAADLMQAHGAAHFQIGRFYPYLRGRNATAVALLKAVKAELDPKGILNPGVLGL
jgi:FAD/FMN-containing dehydrogenase